MVKNSRFSQSTFAKKKVNNRKKKGDNKKKKVRNGVYLKRLFWGYFYLFLGSYFLALL